jgi:hypothetical protein
MQGRFSDKRWIDVISKADLLPSLPGMHVGEFPPQSHGTPVPPGNSPPGSDTQSPREPSIGPESSGNIVGADLGLTSTGIRTGAPLQPDSFLHQRVTSSEAVPLGAHSHTSTRDATAPIIAEFGEPQEGNLPAAVSGRSPTGTLEEGEGFGEGTGGQTDTSPEGDREVGFGPEDASESKIGTLENAVIATGPVETLRGRRAEARTVEEIGATGRPGHNLERIHGKEERTAPTGLPDDVQRSGDSEMAVAQRQVSKIARHQGFGSPGDGCGSSGDRVGGDANHAMTEPVQAFKEPLELLALLPNAVLVSSKTEEGIDILKEEVMRMLSPKARSSPTAQG